MDNRSESERVRECVRERRTCSTDKKKRDTETERGEI